MNWRSVLLASFAMFAAGCQTTPTPNPDLLRQQTAAALNFCLQVRSAAERKALVDRMNLTPLPSPRLKALTASLATHPNILENGAKAWSWTGSDDLMLWLAEDSAAGQGECGLKLLGDIGISSTELWRIVLKGYPGARQNGPAFSVGGGDSVSGWTIASSPRSTRCAVLMLSEPLPPTAFYHFAPLSLMAFDGESGDATPCESN